MYDVKCIIVFQYKIRHLNLPEEGSYVQLGKDN